MRKYKVKCVLEYDVVLSDKDLKELKKIKDVDEGDIKRVILERLEDDFISNNTTLENEFEENLEIKEVE